MTSYETMITKISDKIMKKVDYSTQGRDISNLVHLACASKSAKVAADVEAECRSRLPGSVAQEASR